MSEEKVDSLSSWSCRVERWEESGKKDESSNQLGPNEITVGQKLALYCEGNEANFIEDALRIEYGEGDYKLYHLHLLEVKSLKGAEGTFVVTSYIAGDYPKENVLPVLSDGLTQMSLTGFNWKTITSVEPQAQGQGEEQQAPQPHPPFGPAKMSLPWIELAFWLGLVVLIAGIFYFFVRLFTKRKEEFQSIEALRAARSPIDELYFRIRKAHKKHLASDVEPAKFVSELSQSYRIFIATQLSFPAHVWSYRRIVKYIKKKQSRFYRRHGDRFKRSLYEVMYTKRSEISVQDAEVNMELIKTVSDEISRLNVKGGRK